MAGDRGDLKNGGIQRTLDDGNLVVTGSKLFT
jgi:hypothetical protein